jgi:hypothetical protein
VRVELARGEAAVRVVSHQRAEAAGKRFLAEPRRPPAVIRRRRRDRGQRCGNVLLGLGGFQDLADPVLNLPDPALDGRERAILGREFAVEEVGDDPVSGMDREGVPGDFGEVVGIG